MTTEHDNTERRRAVITGMGPVTCLGLGREAFGAALAASRGGVSELTLFDASASGRTMAAEIPPFEVEDYLLSPTTYLDRGTETALAATRLAVDDAGLDPEMLTGSYAALLTGTAMGTMQTAEDFFGGFLKKGPRFVKPLLFPHAYSNTSISMLAIEYGVKGPHLNFASGFAAAGQAVLAAMDLIQAGRCELCLVGGFDTLSEFLLTGCGKAGWTSHATESQPERCAPFDINRNGFTAGEAGAMLVMESREHADNRNAAPLAELVAGAERNCLSQEEIPAAVLDAMRKVSEDGMPDLVLANANGSILLDDAEAKAIMTFAQAIPATSVKPLVGETFGASGALQVASATCILESGIVPRTLNTRELSSEYDLDLVRGPRPELSPRRIVTNVIDPGGTVVSLMIAAAR